MADLLKTPDGRYLVVRGRLWRCADPRLTVVERKKATNELMDARRAIARIKRSDGSANELAAARQEVDRAKTALGERGPVWWSDGAPDHNRRMARNTPYAEWYLSLGHGLLKDQAASKRSSE